MAKYIDADRLCAEIEKIYKSEIQPWLSGVSATSAIYDYVLPLIDSLQQEQQEKPVSKDLKEAAIDIADALLAKPKDYALSAKADYWNGAHDGIIAGAKWQAEKDARDMYMSDNRHYEKVYQLGKKDMKEQMMKEAVEGDIGMTLHDKRADLYVRSKGYLPESLGIKCNDKVRIIIVKEDEK